MSNLEAIEYFGEAVQFFTVVLADPERGFDSGLQALFSPEICNSTEEAYEHLVTISLPFTVRLYGEPLFIHITVAHTRYP